MREFGQVHHFRPAPQSWRRRVLSLSIFGLLTLAALPSPAWAAPNCPALGPSGFGVSLTNPGPDLGEYRALVTFDTATLVAAGEMRADGGDLRVSDAACNQYDFWIESGFDTGATRVWVKAPAVPTGQSLFVVHHGDLTLTRVNQAIDVFGDGVASLYTFTEGTGAIVHDWVGGHDLDLQGTAAWTTGPRGGIGAVNALAATGRLFATGNGPQLGAGDFSAFVMVNLLSGDRNGSTRGLIGNYQSDGATGWILKMQGGAGQFMLLTNQAGNWCQQSGGNVPADTWNMLGARRQSGVTNSLIHNGAIVANVCPNDARNVNGGGPMEIGRGYNGSAGYAISGTASMALVYGRALTDQETATLYTSLFPAVPPTLAIVATPPGAPAITGVASAVTSISLTFSPGDDGGAPITEYTATCTAGAAFSQTGPSSPLTVAGLTTGVTYSCTVAASNVSGSGPPSAPVLVSAGVPPVITSPASATFTELLAGGFTVTATGLPALALSVAGALPSGVTFNPATGALAGTPAVGSEGTYPLTITATNGVGPDATQPFTLIIISGVPHSPANVRVAANGALVTLSWEPASSGAPAEWFLIEVGTVSGLTDVLTQLTRAQSDHGLLPDGTYFMRVRGVTRAGLGPASVEARVQVSSGQPIAGPVGAAGVAVNGAAVRLSWQRSTIGVPPTGYRLEVGRSHGASDVAVLELPASATSFSASGVPPGVYSASVRALSPAGQTPRSHDVMFVVGEQAACASSPSRQVLLTPLVSGSTAALAWLPQDDFATTTGYRLQVGSTSGSSNLGEVGPLSPSSTLVASVPDGSYFVRLVSSNACGDSPTSAEQVVTVGSFVPAAPSGLTSQVATNALTLNWTAPIGPVTDYVVEAGLSSGATDLSVPTGSTAPTFAASNVPSGTYFVRVRARNAAGTGAASNEVTVVVP